MIRSARLLVYLDENPKKLKNTKIDAWRKAAAALNNGRLEVSPDEVGNHGYQSGAMYAMWIPLAKGWFEGYDWVIRINPDVFPLDDA